LPALSTPVVSIAGRGRVGLVQTFVVIVIRGVGSFPGAVLGGLIAGEIISITSMFNPGYARHAVRGDDIGAGHASLRTAPTADRE
jgi:branched-subunit amino acid ABC-type transport system permease component